MWPPEEKQQTIGSRGGTGGVCVCLVWMLRGPRWYYSIHTNTEGHNPPMSFCLLLFFTCHIFRALLCLFFPCIDSFKLQGLKTRKPGF